MKKYKYLYYKLFCLWLKKKNESKNARINAVITITFLIYTNIISIPLILLAIYKKEIIDLPEISGNIKIWIISILSGVGILNYFFLAKSNHNKIIEMFIGESEKQRKKGMLFTIIYCVISLVIPLYIFLFTVPK